ncbi:ADP-ribosylglycohydrolase family protein [Streptomyces sp. CoH27]|uniref:ADP-ribosylglycohydrolase family protein n=1 Tax=Streptomyces sp. CoH27 TaxID=2875763 RepID=UPI001CD51DA2|nr:ADP-ribosylglycohydrolase family protein [Streptomyces sp. CoH27]
MAEEEPTDRRSKALRTESRVRGMMLGLGIGDTLGAARGNLPPSGVLRAGVSTQLACFTAEGVIRAMVRASHKGICHPPGVVLHAYCRWAALQGIEVQRMRRRWGSSMGEGEWPDGWLAGVPVLAERRGSAPATVAALSRIETPHDEIATASRGCHALTRSLPIAVVGIGWAQQAGDFAGLTHGDSAARSATAQAAVLLHHCLTSTPPDDDHTGRSDRAVRQALEAGAATLGDLDERVTDDARRRLLAAMQHAAGQPAQAAVLARLAPDATAPSALLGGIYTAAWFPGRAQLRDALDFAAGAPDGDSVACVTGALLGAVHGFEALPLDLVSRHELAWVLDTLARDMLSETTDSPSGSEYVRGWDPHWWDGYPGW